MNQHHDFNAEVRFKIPLTSKSGFQNAMPSVVYLPSAYTVSWIFFIFNIVKWLRPTQIPHKYEPNSLKMRVTPYEEWHTNCGTFFKPYCIGNMFKICCTVTRHETVYEVPYFKHDLLCSYIAWALFCHKVLG